MKITTLRLLAPVLLAIGFATPAYSQTKEPATKFFNFLCEIDLTVLDLPVQPPGFPEGGSVFTFTSTKYCAGSASARNAKIECARSIPGWSHTVNVSASGFDCKINGDTCDLVVVDGDPFVTTTITSLTVDTKGRAKLTCFHKP